MGMNALLDIAIGLVLMYLVLSVACTSINEIFTTLTAARANSLKQSLLKIIDVDTLRSTFYGHGLIDGTKTDDKSHPSYLSGSTFALALIDSLDTTVSLPSVAAIETKVKQTLPASNVRDILLSNISMAAGNMDKLRTNLAMSFDRSMDRVNGAYKRYMKLISFIVGCALAMALNADTIEVAKSLWTDGTLRAEMVQAAQTVYANGAPGNSTTPSPAPQLPQVASQIKSADTTLRPLPIGWDFSKFKVPDDFHWYWTHIGRALLKIGGLLITGIALMLGAPFWFDVLSKFMSIRGAGDKPARTTPTTNTGTPP
jgi:hypothetical protein